LVVAVDQNCQSILRESFYRDKLQSSVCPVDRVDLYCRRTAAVFLRADGRVDGLPEIRQQIVRGIARVASSQLDQNSSRQF